MTISGMSASGFTNLLSGLGGNSNSVNNLMNFNVSDYNSIKSGTYYRLLKSYYASDSENGKKTSDSFKNPYTTSTSKETNSTLAKIESAADDLTESAKDLYSNNAKAFKKITSTDEDGKTTTDYDKDAIYKAVNSFVEDYNSLIKSAGKSDADGIARAAASMATLTNQNANALNSLGITIDKDSYTLSLDKDAFMQADMSKAKNLFNGMGSYAYDVATKASMLNYQAEREASKANTYGSTGTYNSNYSAGSIYNTYF